MAALFPTKAKAEIEVKRSEGDRQQEFASHITAAVDLLNSPEKDKLKTLLRQPSILGVLESLMSVCSSVASESSDYIASQPHVCPRDVAILQKSALAMNMDGLTAQPQVDTVQNVLHTFGTSLVSPRVLGGSGVTPRTADSYGTHWNGSQSTRGAVKSNPPDYGPALLDHIQDSQRNLRRRSVVEDAGYNGRPASPRRRKSGPPSSRDKVWDLLTSREKDQILADHMSAAEGTKMLLERRAMQLGVEVVEMTDDDDWDIGFKLTECKATSEPLAKPKNCSICLRNGVVFHRHSYYCRRCAQLYRAIHRKKTTLQNSANGGNC